MDKKDLKLKSLQKHLELSEPIDMKYVTASDFLTDIVVKYVANENIELTDKQKEGFKKSYNFIKSKEEQKDVEPIGNYIGNIKQRYDMTLKYISTNNTSRGYYVHNFEDRKGNSLICFSDNERIEINNIATNRSILAKGAIRSAIWAYSSGPGFFSLKDVIKHN